MWHQLRAARSRVVRYVIQRGALPVLSLVALSGCAKGKGDSVEPEVSFSQFVVDLVKQNVKQGEAGAQKLNFVEKKETVLKEAVDRVVKPPLPIPNSKKRLAVSRATSGVTPFPNPWMESNSHSEDEMSIQLPTLLGEGLKLVKTGQMAELSIVIADVLGMATEEFLPVLKRFGPVWQNMEERTVQQLVQLAGELVRIARKAEANGEKNNDKVIAALFDWLQDVLDTQEQTETIALAGRVLPMLREIVESEGACEALKKFIMASRPEDLPVLKKVISRLVELEPVLASLSKQQLRDIFAVALRDVGGNEDIKPEEMNRGMELFAMLGESSEYRKVFAVSKDLVSRWRNKVPDQGQRDRAVTRLLQIVETIRPAKSSSSQKAPQPSIDQKVDSVRAIFAEIPKYKDTIALALPVFSRLSDGDFQLLAKVIIGVIRSGGRSGLHTLTPPVIHRLVEHVVALLEHKSVLQALPRILTALQSCAGRDPLGQIAALRAPLFSIKQILLSDGYDAARLRNHVMEIVRIADPGAGELLRKLLMDHQKLRVVLDAGYRVFDEERSNLGELANSGSLVAMESLATQCPEAMETLRQMAVGLGQNNRQQLVTRSLRLAKVLRGWELFDRQNVQLGAESVCSHVKLAAHLAGEIDSAVRWLLEQNDQNFALILGFLKWAGENREHLLAQRQDQRHEVGDSVLNEQLNHDQIKQLVGAVVGLAKSTDGWQQLLPLVPRFVNAVNGNSNRQKLVQAVSNSLLLIKDKLLVEGEAGVSRREHLHNIIEHAGPCQAVELFDALLGTLGGRDHLRNILVVFPSVQEYVDVSETRQMKEMINQVFPKIPNLKWLMETFNRFARGDALQWFRENNDERIRSKFDRAVQLAPHVIGLANQLKEQESLPQLKDLLLGLVDWKTKSWEQRWSLVYDKLEFIQKGILKEDKSTVRTHLYEILKLVKKPYAPTFKAMVMQQNNRKNLSKGLAMLQEAWGDLDSGERSKFIQTAKTLYTNYHEHLQVGIGNGEDEKTDSLFVALTSEQGERFIKNVLHLLVVSQGEKSVTAALTQLLKNDNLGQKLVDLIESAQKLQKTVVAGKLYVKLRQQGALPNTEFRDARQSLLRRILLHGERDRRENQNDTEITTFVNQLQRGNLSLELPIRVVAWVKKIPNNVQDLGQVKDLLDKVDRVLVDNPEFFKAFSEGGPTAQKSFALLTGERGEVLVGQLYCIVRQALTNFEQIEKAFPAEFMVQVLGGAQELSSSGSKEPKNVDPFKNVEWWLEFAERNSTIVSSRLVSGIVKISSWISRSKKIGLVDKMLTTQSRRNALPKILKMYKIWNETKPTQLALVQKDKTWVTLATTSVQLAKVAVGEQRLLQARLQQERQQVPVVNEDRPVVGDVEPVNLGEIDVTDQRDLLLSGWGIAENLDLDPRRMMIASGSPRKANGVFSAVGAIQSTSLRELPALGYNSQWWLNLLYPNRDTTFAALRELSEDLNDDTSLTATAVRLQERVLTELDCSVIEELIGNSDDGDKPKRILLEGLERLFRSKNDKTSPMAAFISFYLELKRIEKHAVMLVQESTFNQQPRRSNSLRAVGYTMDDFMETLGKLENFSRDRLPQIWGIVQQLFSTKVSVPSNHNVPPLGFEHGQRPLVAVPAG